MFLDTGGVLPEAQSQVALGPEDIGLSQGGPKGESEIRSVKGQ